MENKFICLLILGIQILDCVDGGEWCTNWDTGREYCSDCCGDWPYEECCDVEVNWVVGVSVGCALGGLFLIGLCVVFICIFIQKKGKTGRIVQPSVQPPTYSSTAVYTVQYDQQGVSYGQQGVPYAQQGVPYGNQGKLYGQEGVVQPPTYTSAPEYPPSYGNLYGNQASAPP